MSGHKFDTAEAAMSFLQAGKAIITIKSLKTETRFTYRIRESKDGRVFFVGLLTGADNESTYSYIGIIRDGLFRWTSKSKISADAPGVKAFAWTYYQLSKAALPDTVEVWHNGRCGRCGKTLTVPESIQSGYGPECQQMLRRASPQLTMAV